MAGRWRTLASVGPVVAEAMRGNAVLRAFSGYMVFFFAFLLQTAHFSVSHNFALGALVAAAAARQPGGDGDRLPDSAPGPRSSSCSPCSPLAPIVAAVAPGSSAWRRPSRWRSPPRSRASLAKLSLDSTVQREIGEEIRSSAFAVSETLNQVANVAGSLAGVLVSMLDNGQAGLAIAAACLTAALVTLVARRRRRILAQRTSEAPARRPGPSPAPPHGSR